MRNCWWCTGGHLPNPDEILDANLDWADGIARDVWRGLPPSFDLADLQQIARLETWERAREWDPKKNDNFRGYAYLWVLNAVRMATRRRAYSDATCDELPNSPVDDRPTPEQAMIQGERDKREASTDQAAIEVLRGFMSLLSATESYLVQRVYFDGIEVAELAATWKIEKAYIVRRLSSAVRALKRAGARG